MARLVGKPDRPCPHLERALIRVSLAADVDDSSGVAERGGSSVGPRELTNTKMARIRRILSVRFGDPAPEPARLVPSQHPVSRRAEPGQKSRMPPDYSAQPALLSHYRGAARRQGQSRGGIQAAGPLQGQHHLDIYGHVFEGRERGTADSFAQWMENQAMDQQSMDSEP